MTRDPPDMRAHSHFFQVSDSSTATRTSTREFHVLTSAGPMIENSSGLSFGSYDWREEHVDQDLESCAISRDKDCGRDVVDFNWLSGEKSSPNWTLVPPDASSASRKRWESHQVCSLSGSPVVKRPSHSPIILIVRRSQKVGEPVERESFFQRLERQQTKIPAGICAPRSAGCCVAPTQAALPVVRRKVGAKSSPFGTRGTSRGQELAREEKELLFHFSGTSAYERDGRVMLFYESA